MALNGVVNGSLVKTINISKNKSVVDFFLTEAVRNVIIL